MSDGARAQLIHIDVDRRLGHEWDEWDGKPLPKDQLFNERFVVRGTKFSRPQTAPDGTEIQGESGRLSLLDEPRNAIDFRMWEGTAHGLYQLKDDELTLCVTRHGGLRPDSFLTRAGDSRVLKTYRRRRSCRGSMRRTSTACGGQKRRSSCS